MLRIQYLSDLHLEFIAPHEINAAIQRIVPKARVLVLAGDIGHPSMPHYAQFLQGVSAKFEHTFFVHGNHEYYGAESVESAVGISRSLNSDTLHFLHNSSHDIGQFRFIGTPLWTHIADLDYQINDAECIPGFDARLFNRVHRISQTWIHAKINTAEKEGKIPIVITHHMPSFQLIPEKYRKYGKINQCFASDSDRLIRPPVAAWIYGHTHTPGAATINRVPCLTNPVGYPGENVAPDYGKTVDVSGEQ